MILTEIEADLFSLSKYQYAFAHCISSDFRLGAGIAVKFAELGFRKVLMERHKPMWQGKGYAIVEHNDCMVVGNLVTKEHYYDKPTLKTMEEALISLRKQLENRGLEMLAIPRIGCGLDKLDWEDVKALIEKVFDETNLDIVVCHMEG